MTNGAGGVLRKKLSRIQTRGYNFPVQSKLAAKLEYAAAKGATEALGVTVEAIVEQSRVDRLGALSESLPTPGLFIVLEAPAGDMGLIGFDMRLVDHVVEIQAGGDPNTAEALQTRTPTAIDTAFCLPVMDSVMEHFYGEMNALPGGVRLEKFQKGRIEHMPTNLPYLLPDQQYLGCRVNLDIGDDARTGVFHLALPLSWIEPVENILRQSAFSPAQAESEIWGKQMRKVVRRAPLHVTAEIDRSKMHVAELSRLRVGTLFPLSDATLDDVVLMLKIGGESKPIGHGRLGSFKRCKAVRVLEISQSEFLEPLARKLEMDAADE
ncbi:MAG TPA: FliM/FliN family flagellar motor switch protein [Thermohalobaculum sp.]|nr:FliM/FliN family flagellar motor switch protein [Thermohalobaculum sp.]